MAKISRRGMWIAAKLAAGVAAVAALLPATSALLAREEPAAPARPAPTPAKAQPKAPAPQRVAEATPRPDPQRTLSNITVTRELPITRWLRPGEFAWDDEGAPAGPAVIVVNIRGRVLSVFRGGVEIGRSSLIYGADDKPTPHGTFPILEKDIDHHSNLYDAPMPYMLRLTWDGVAIHSSAQLADDVGTHGCIGLPDEFAAKLFEVARVGDQVVVWDGERPT